MSRRGLALAAGLVLAAWAFFPVVALLVHAAAHHARYTGADGLIGADGVLGADQLQYLAWVRDAAGHGPAADLFWLGRPAHVYLEPVFGVAGALTAAGVSLVVAYLAVKLACVAVLAVGTVAWVMRLVDAGPPGAARGPRIAALALAVGFSTPAAALVDWLQLGGARFRFDAYLLGDELTVATKLWGYVPAALAVGLMPVALLALERALPGPPAPAVVPSPPTQPGDREIPGPRRRRYRESSRRSTPALAAAAAAAAALVASWVHPWQGITLALIVLGAAAWRRTPREWPAFAVVLAAALAPLAYYLVLRHADPAWRFAAANEDVARPSALLLLACGGPVLALAALGATSPRRGPAQLAEQALLLWIPAALAAYLVNDAFATHALEGVSLPMAVLAVRGWRRLRAPAAVGALAVAALTVPCLAYAARKFVRVAASGQITYELPRSDAAALRWVRAHAPRGGVLAPVPFAAAVPSQTGRAVWVGHGDWSPDYVARSREVAALVSGRTTPAAARAFVVATGARVLVADCAHPAAGLASRLAPLVAAERRFGCARVLVLRR